MPETHQYTALLDFPLGSRRVAKGDTIRLSEGQAEGPLRMRWIERHDATAAAAAPEAPAPKPRSRRKRAGK